MTRLLTMSALTAAAIITAVSIASAEAAPVSLATIINQLRGVQDVATPARARVRYRARRHLHGLRPSPVIVAPDTENVIVASGDDAPTERVETVSVQVVGWIPPVSAQLAWIDAELPQWTRPDMNIDWREPAKRPSIEIGVVWSIILGLCLGFFGGAIVALALRPSARRRVANVIADWKMKWRRHQMEIAT